MFIATNIYSQEVSYLNKEKVQIFVGKCMENTFQTLSVFSFLLFNCIIMQLYGVVALDLGRAKGNDF